MIPLNDVEPNRYTSLPYMTLLLIIVNAGVLFYERTLFPENGEQFLQWLYLYGTVPSLVISQQSGGAITAVTHMFLHGDVWHLLSNMLGLWVFGRRIEDVCGPWRFLMFYLVCGIVADVISTMIQFESTRPGIGASGAIFGIMGAYLIVFPRGRIRTLVLFFNVPLLPKIRAYWIILYFLTLQLGPAFFTVLYDAQFGIGYWAHLGGFFGSLFIFLFLRSEAFHRLRNELPL